MSGPKYFDYVLESIRLIELNAKLEAEIELSQCRQITKNINNCIEKSKEYFSQINIDKYKSNISTAENLLKSDASIEEVKSLLSELIAVMNKEYNIEGDSNALSYVLDAYNKRLQRAKNIVSQINALMKGISVQYNRKNHERLELEFENTQWTEPVAVSNLSEDLIRTYSHIIEQLMSDENFDVEKMKYDMIINDHSFDDNYKISQMKMRFDSYLIEKQADNNTIEVLKLRSKYTVLSNLIQSYQKNIPEDIDKMKEEISEMERIVQENKIGEYVAVCIDRVMDELGYDVIGSEVLSPQRMTKQLYDYSDNSAITVASSGNGATMLEVVGKKKGDKMIGSATMVRNDMERFCPDYIKIKEGLQKYGIILTDRKLFPPDEKYVRYVEVSNSASGDRRAIAENKKRVFKNE